MLLIRHIQDISKNKKNTILIIYKNDNNEKEIRLFGEKFILNNEDNCRILYKNKEYELSSKFNVENINQLEIQLNGFLNIINMEEMFKDCVNLISLPDIHLIDTIKITNMNYMFKGCSSLVSLPDITNWNIDNVTEMNGMFEGCDKLLNKPDLGQKRITINLNIK